MTKLTTFILLFQAQAAKLPEFRIADMFKPLASPGQQEKEVAMLTFAITGIIFVVVASLICYAIFRFRRKPGDDMHQEPAQVYGSNQIEVAWTVIPILIVFILVGVSARVIAGVQNASPPKDTLHVTIIGHQWWWEVWYPEYGIRTANEIHVPAGAEGKVATYFQLESADVIHSFWIPQLSGKTDVIPNRTNYMWIDPYKAGVYFGNCAEYCGTQHANMLLRVVAQEPADFKQWTIDQQRKQPQVTNAIPAGGQLQAASLKTGPNQLSQAAQNQAAFKSLSCVNCHMVQGTAAAGKFGPDLTHLMSRSTIAAGAVDLTHDNLRKWVDDPQDIKPGCLMPSLKLTNHELDQVVAYLETLH